MASVRSHAILIIAGTSVSHFIHHLRSECTINGKLHNGCFVTTRGSIQIGQTVVMVNVNVCFAALKPLAYASARSSASYNPESYFALIVSSPFLKPWHSKAHQSKPGYRIVARRPGSRKLSVGYLWPLQPHCLRGSITGCTCRGPLQR
jgi:hypothetical protein